MQATEPRTPVAERVKGQSLAHRNAAGAHAAFTAAAMRKKRGLARILPDTQRQRARWECQGSRNAPRPPQAFAPGRLAKNRAAPRRSERMQPHERNAFSCWSRHCCGCNVGKANACAPVHSGFSWESPHGGNLPQQACGPTDRARFCCSRQELRPTGVFCRARP